VRFSASSVPTPLSSVTLQLPSPLAYWRSVPAGWGMRHGPPTYLPLSAALGSSEPAGLDDAAGQDLEESTLPKVTPVGFDGAFGIWLESTPTP